MVTTRFLYIVSVMKLQRMGDMQAYCGTNKSSDLKLFDKLKAKVTLADMVDKEVNKRISKIGLSGGHLRLSYNSKKNALWLKVDYLSAKELSAKDIILIQKFNMSHLCDATGCKLFESEYLNNRLLLVWGEDEISEQRNVKVYPYDILEKNRNYKFVAYGFASIGVLCLALLLFIGVSASDKVLVSDKIIEMLVFVLVLSTLITTFFDNKSLT